MKTRIHETVYTHLNLNFPTSESEIHEVLDRLDKGGGVPVYSDEGLAVLKTALLSGDVDNIAVEDVGLGQEGWRYISFQLDSNTVMEIVLCPDGPLEGWGAPPTNAEIVLVKAWASGSIPTAVDRSGVVLYHTNHETAPKEANQVSALLSLSDIRCAQRSVPQYASPIQNADSFSLQASSKILKTKSKFPDLLQNAVQQTSIKWRYLQFYRIFEQGYLANILEELNRDFTKSPSESLTAAQNSMKSEVSQLKSLIETSNLAPYFEEVVQALKILVNASNRFACAINKKIEGREKSPGAFRRGAEIIYAVRCAIAHAGLGDLFYEGYDDAENVLVELTPIIELAALEFLGVSIVKTAAVDEGVP